MSFLEEAWKQREEHSFKELFGDIGTAIFPLSKENFNRLDAHSVDPRWLTHGVFISPPADLRETWVYVTSGMSNPWEADVPEEYSGLGVEFLMETENEETWAIEVLQTLMAYNLLLAAGQMGDFQPFDYGHRVPLSLSKSIAAMMFCRPVRYPSKFSLKSGDVDLLQVVGITLAEQEQAKQFSSNEIIKKIVLETGGLVTSKERKSVV